MNKAVVILAEGIKTLVALCRLPFSYLAYKRQQSKYHALKG